MSALRVGIAGFGAIGRSIAQYLIKGIPNIELSAVGVRNPNNPRKFDWGKHQAPIFCLLEELEPHCDIVIECAPAELFSTIAVPVLEAGKKLISLSSGALLNHTELIDLADKHQGQILVPSGAILGLDALFAAAQGNISSVKMISKKPPIGFLGAPHVEKMGIDIMSIKEPTLLYSGTAREVAEGFPANLNVAISVSLAGIGPDKTEIEVWADPTIIYNTHKIHVNSDSALLTMQIENIPSENPKTGRITAQSVIALLKKQSAALAIGT